MSAFMGAFAVRRLTEESEVNDPWIAPFDVLSLVLLAANACFYLLFTPCSLCITPVYPFSISCFLENSTPLTFSQAFLFLLQQTYTNSTFPIPLTLRLLC